MLFRSVEEQVLSLDLAPSVMEMTIDQPMRNIQGKSWAQLAAGPRHQSIVEAAQADAEDDEESDQKGRDAKDDARTSGNAPAARNASIAVDF